LKKIISVFVLCQILLALLAIFNDLISNAFQQSGIDEFDSFKEKVFLVLVFAPIFETIVFNLILNEIFFKLFGKAVYAIILSSILFGLIHYYSWTYVISTFLAGLVFNGFYFWIRKQNGFWLATLGVFLLHFNHNLIGILLGK